MYEYITIEREYGSGGNGIAKELADRLNYRLFDHNVVVETCKRLDMPYEFVSSMDEQNSVKSFFKAPGKDYESFEDQIFRTERDIIREAAETPGCIFVGRCASEIINDKKCLKVFIRASRSYRLDRAIRVEKIGPNEAEEVMRRFDKRREKFFNAHANGKWGSPEYFDLILNSGSLGTDGCLAVLEALAK